LEIDSKGNRGIRLGFNSVSSLKTEAAQSIETFRGDIPFSSIKEFASRTQLSDANISSLASADAFRSIAGDRYRARWQASALLPTSVLLGESESVEDDLLMSGPSLEQNVMNDYASIGLTLRTHPMEILRSEYPFNRCKRHIDLVNLRNEGFVRIAGIVTGKQRPGTASGVMFLSLEDETGTSNIIVWSSTQERFRREILTGKLLIIKGIVQVVTDGVAVPIIHIVAGHVQNLSDRLHNLALKSRDFH
jgi:error-prone DNA polymerase